MFVGILVVLMLDMKHSNKVRNLKQNNCSKQHLYLSGNKVVTIASYKITKTLPKKIVCRQQFD